MNYVTYLYIFKSGLQDKKVDLQEFWLDAIFNKKSKINEMLDWRLNDSLFDGKTPENDTTTFLRKQVLPYLVSTIPTYLIPFKVCHKKGTIWQFVCVLQYDPLVLRKNGGTIVCSMNDPIPQSKMHVLH